MRRKTKHSFDGQFYQEYSYQNLLNWITYNEFIMKKNLVCFYASQCICHFNLFTDNYPAVSARRVYNSCLTVIGLIMSSAVSVGAYAGADLEISTRVE